MSDRAGVVVPCGHVRHARGERRHGLEVDLADLRVPALGMLAAAAALPHLPEGLGVPCPLRATTGIPCPLCGMTTSVTAVVGLQWGDALRAAPAGFLAVAVAIMAVVLWRRPIRVRIPGWTAALGLGSMWVFQLFRFGILE